MSVISAHDLSVIKRDRLLFERLSFDLCKGNLLYVKGPNGAGKTSLLRVLTGLVEPESGQVRFAQKHIKSCREEYNQQLVYFGHKLGINHSLSAVENLSYWCQQHHVKVCRQQIFTTLETLNLVGLEDIPAGNLSAGQQRRVALARFWLNNHARLWILDEPFTALDTQGIALLTEKLQDFLAAQGAVIMTSHQKLDFACTQELYLEYRL